jgi:N-acetylneuraminic acid mutarotase
MNHAAVWTGSEMLVWGGGGRNSSGGLINLNSGGSYDPLTDSWKALSTTNAPAGRLNPGAVWSGHEMLVWGGFINGATYTNTGGRLGFIYPIYLPAVTR